MSEVNQPENKLPQTIENYVASQYLLLQNAVDAMVGTPHDDPLDVFPEPTEVRQDATQLELDAETESKLRAAAAEFGIGGIEDTASSADHQVIEGGLAWKIAAEARISNPDKAFIFAGSPARKVNDREKEFMAGLVEGTAIGDTEYEIARQIAASQPGFEPLEQDAVLPFGYEVTPGGAFTQEPTGQLVQIGENQGRAVVLLRVDQDNPTPPFYRPDSAALLGFVADALDSVGNQDESIGIVTTNTYPSRAIDAMRAGVSHQDRKFDAGMVGRQTMAEVKGEEVQPALLNQIPGELHQIAVKIDKLGKQMTLQHFIY